MTQSDIKRLLAYSTIENAGIIVLGLGAAMVALAYGRSELATLAVAASLAHVLNHAVFKGLLFLGAGSVVMATGTRHTRAVRRTVAAYAVDRAVLPRRRDGDLRPAAAERLHERVADVSGAAARVRVDARSDAAEFPAGRRVLALTTALAAACFVRAFGITFPGAAAEPAAAEAHEAPALMLVPQAFLAAMCIALGLFPGVVLRALGGVMASLPGLQPRGDVAMQRGWR